MPKDTDPLLDYYSGGDADASLNDDSSSGGGEGSSGGGSSDSSSAALASRAPPWQPSSGDSPLASVLPTDLSWLLKTSVFFLLACWQVVEWAVKIVSSKRYFDGCALAPGYNVSLSGDARLYLPGQPLPLPFCISCFNGTRVSTFVPPGLANNLTEALASYSPITAYYDPQAECRDTPSFLTCFLFNIYASTSTLLLFVLLISSVKYNTHMPASYLLRFGVRVRSSKQQMYAGLAFTGAVLAAVLFNTVNQNRESGKSGAESFYTCKDVLGFVVPQGKAVSIQATYLPDNPTAPSDAFLDPHDLLRVLVALIQIAVLYKDFLLDTLALLTPLAGLDLSFAIDASAPGAAAAIAGVQWRVCPVQLYAQWTLLKLQLMRKGWMSAAGEVLCELPGARGEPPRCSLLLCVRPCLGGVFQPPLGTREAHAAPLPGAAGLSLTHFLLLRMQAKGLLEANVADASLGQRLWEGLCPCLQGRLGGCGGGGGGGAGARPHHHHHDRGLVVPLQGAALALDAWLRKESTEPFLEVGFWRGGSGGGGGKS